MTADIICQIFRLGARFAFLVKAMGDLRVRIRSRDEYVWFQTFSQNISLHYILLLWQHDKQMDTRNAWNDT